MIIIRAMWALGLWVFIAVLRLASACGSANAKVALGEMYRDGFGVQQDDAKAEDLFSEAALLGDGRAPGLLAHLRETASKRRAEEQERQESHRQIVDQRHAKTGKNSFAQEHFKVLYQAAESGDPYAQFNLGKMYFLGKGVAQNDEEAVKWYRRAARQGHAAAQFHFGEACYSGWGIPKDHKEAMKWVRRAAEQDFADAQCFLSMMYLSGEGVVWPDVSKAVQWSRRAAEQGHADAQIGLGLAYAGGEGVERNQAEAIKWFRLAAEQGESWGQYFLGEAYAHGIGVAQDDLEALKWYRLAAEQGLAWAQEAVERYHRRAAGQEGEKRESSYQESESREDRDRVKAHRVVDDLDWAASVLGISRDALGANGRNAYKRAMMFAHPDRPGGSEEKAKDLHRVRMILEQAGLWR